MAGGEGVRLRPMTCERPKPMVPVVDRPVIEHIVKLLVQHGICDIAVTLQYLPGEIKSYLEDGAEYGARISYFLEDVPLGTAGSVKNCSSFLDETFVVISGDALTDLNLTEIIRFHQEHQADATIVVKKVAVPVEYGVVLSDEESRITGFQEKPSWGDVTNDKVNTGIYVLSPSVMELCPPNQKRDFAKDIFPLLLEQKRAFYAVETTDYWCDIGDPSTYLRANRDVLEGKVKISLSGYSPQPGIWIGENSILEEHVTLSPPVFIGSNCYIGDKAALGPGCVVGHGTVVEKGAKITESVLWNNSSLAPAVMIEHSILCDKLQLQKGASVKHGILGKGVKIGRYAMVQEGASIWPYRNVAEADSVSRPLTSVRQETKICFSEYGVTSGSSPEYLTRLGCAFGTLMGISASIAVSCDGSGAAQMMMSAVEAGLAATGIQVKRTDSASLSVLRWTCRSGACDGAVSVSCAAKEAEGPVTINLLNGHGNDLCKTERRKLQTIFNKDDYVTVSAPQILPIRQLSDPEDYYIADLSRRFPEAYRALKFSPRQYNRTEREAVTAYLTAALYPDAPVFISVSSALSAEKVAKKYNKNVIRCGSRAGDVMEAMEELMHVPGVYEQYLMLFDDLAFDMAVCHYNAIADGSVPMKRILAELPRIYRTSREFCCDNERKADVIRHFTQDEAIRDQFEVFDGLIRQDNEGVVRMYADEYRPVFRIDVESLREEYGTDLLDKFGKLLDEYLKSSPSN